MLPVHSMAETKSLILKLAFLSRNRALPGMEPEPRGCWEMQISAQWRAGSR